LEKKRWNIKSAYGKFLCAEPSGQVVANRDQAKEWELFTVNRVGGGIQSAPIVSVPQASFGLNVGFTSPVLNVQITPQVSTGRRATFRTHQGKFLCAEPSGQVVANRDQAKEWEHFTLIQVGGGRVNLRTHHGKFVCAEPSGQVIANRDQAKEWESWTLEERGNTCHLRSFHGRYLCADNNGNVIADRDQAKGWETFHINYNN